MGDSRLCQMSISCSIIWKRSAYLPKAFKESKTSCIDHIDGWLVVE